MGSRLLGAFVDPGSLGFMPNTFFLQLSYSLPDPSPDSLDHTPAEHFRLAALLLETLGRADLPFL